jgi:hypothetical protein
MKYYSPVYLEKLDIIQEKVFEFFPKDQLTKSNLFYVPNNLELFLSIPELKSELDKLNFTESVHSFAFYVVQKTSSLGTTHHIDTGDRTYSFNLPILNCNNTFVNFYKTNEAPVEKMLPNKVTYYWYDPTKCKLVDNLEMIQPHIINIKEVHNIVNINNAPRITLLIRLKNNTIVDKLFE